MSTTWRDRLVHLGLAVAVLAGGLVVNHVDRNGGSTRSFVSTGSVGERLPLWPGSVVVHGARAASELETDYQGRPPTNGVWVAVDLSVAGGDQPGPYADVRIVDAQGRTFDATDRAGMQSLGPPQPASPLRGEVAFEVPEDALGDLVVVVAARAEDSLGAEARVPVTVKDVDREPLVIAEPELLGPLP